MYFAPRFNLIKLHYRKIELILAFRRLHPLGIQVLQESIGVGGHASSDSQLAWPHNVEDHMASLYPRNHH